MKYIFSVFLSLFVSVTAMFAQPGVANVETKNGKKYYVHIVEKGNTLYGIHRIYNTSIEAILSANEGLSNDLELGQKVYVPIATSNTDHYAKHTVQKGETLYGISKKYQCTVDDLKNINDGLSDGISPGQVIAVPKKQNGAGTSSEVIQTDPIVTTKPLYENKYEVSMSDSIVEHTVLPHETLYSIAKRYMVTTDTIMVINKLRNARIKKGTILKIPIKKVNYTVVEKVLQDTSLVDTLATITDLPKFKERYNVALMLPLMLDLNEGQMNKPLKLNQVREMYSTTKISFDFYQGFLLAADSLTKAGLNVDVYVYDTKKDTNEIAKIFNKSEFQEMDLVVGPLYRNTIKFAAKKCLEKNIRIVLPFNTDTDIIYQNSFVFKSVASNMTLLDGAIDYVVEQHNHHNVILLKPTLSSDLSLYERARERFNEAIKKMPNTYNTSIVESSLGSSGGRDLNALVKKDTVNIFIIPSTNLSFVSDAMSRLNKVMNMNPYAKKFKIIAFGLEEWNKFEDLDVKYRNRTNQHYASYRYVDFNSEKGIEFVRAFRANYGTDPNVYSSQGFDVGMYFFSALHLYGTNFDLSIDQHQLDLVQNQFNFRKINTTSGYENQRVTIIKYDDYKLKKMN